MQPQQISRFAIKNYINYIDEYYFYKNIKQKNEYKVDMAKLNIDEIVRKKATNCSKLMLKLLPKLYHIKNLKPFFKAFKIALEEKVILSSLLRIPN